MNTLTSRKSSSSAAASTSNHANAATDLREDPLITVSDLVIRYGAYTAVSGVDLSVREGEHLTLLGPSGCGKTTTLRSLAGLEKPSSGEIWIAGQPMFSSREHVNLPSEKRGVSMVFQSYAIWPHMSVKENVAYGLKVRRLGRTETEEAVRRSLALVQMSEFADRPASMLSGGQQQRVALARAIAFSPKVVLFDEPLSNLDAKLRNEMRVELRDLQNQLGISSIYVTHDQEEALAISDRIVVMNAGRIEQIGSPEDIYNCPQNRFVADFVGSANIISGRVRGSETSSGKFAFEAEGGQTLHGVATGSLHSDATEIAIRTAYLQLYDVKPKDGSNQIAGKIRRRMFHGDFIQYLVQWSGGQLVVRRSPTEGFAEGDDVTVCFAPEHCVLLDPASP